MKDFEVNAFNALSLEHKAWLINEFGAHLTSIEYYDYWIRLYAFNSHFVEVYEHLPRRQVHAITMAAYNDLDKYLSRILIRTITKSNH